MARKVFFYIWFTCNTLLGISIFSAWQLGKHFYKECLTQSCAQPMWGLLISAGGLSFILICLSFAAAQQSVQSDVLPCGHDPKNLRLGNDGIYGCAECLATRR